MSGQNNEVRGIRKLSTFITASALLVVVLLVWAQLWIRMFEFPAAIEINVGVGLIWTYFAVFLSLLALILAVWHSLKEGNNKAPKFAIALFGTSAAMAIIDVSQSIVSILKKLTMPDTSIYSSLDLLMLDRWFLWLVGVYAVSLVVGVGILIYRASRFKESKREQVAWIICGIVLFLVGLFSLIYLLCAF